jgi:hypothetical protein
VFERYVGKVQDNISKETEYHHYLEEEVQSNEEKI